MRKVFRGPFGFGLKCALLFALLLGAPARAAVPSGPPPRALEPELLTAQRPPSPMLQAPPPRPVALPATPAAPATAKSQAEAAPHHEPAQATAGGPATPAAPATPGASAAATSLSPTEKWVLSELEAKRFVDLSNKPGAWLSGAFVKSLIDGSVSPGGEVLNVHISNTEVRGEVRLDAAPAAAVVAFDHVHFLEGFFASEARFSGSLKLTNLTVSGELVLDAGSVGGALELQGATFEKRVSLSGVDVQGALFLDHTTFSRGLELKNANVAGTVQWYRGTVGCVDSCRDSLSLSLSEARIGHDLVLSDVDVAGNIQAEYLSVDGNLQIERGSFLESADFAAGRVGGYLVLDLPKAPAGLRLSQLRYGSISNGQRHYNAASTWQDLKRLFARSEYSGDIYAHLEEFFHDSGEAGIADDVYVERRIQERKKLSGPAYCLNWLTYLTIGYGRHPERAFVWMALFVALGMWIFWKAEQMDDVDPDKPKLTYNAFWYSLDLFVPIARLQGADRWAPKQRRHFAWIYLRLHVLLGWVLVPLGLAAVSGLIQ